MIPLVTAKAGGAALAAALLVSTGIIAAQFGTERLGNDEPFRGLDVSTPGRIEYSWPDPVAADGAGATLPVDPGSVPRVVQQLLPQGGAEPSVGRTSAGNLFVVTGETVQRSGDHGRTWETVYNFVTPNYPVTVDRFGSFDPYLWVDLTTDRVFVLHMTALVQPVFQPYCHDLAWSDDEGQTWQFPALRGQFCDTPGVLDHPKLITAPYGPDTVVPVDGTPVTGGYPNVVYLCSNKPTGTWCAVSYDGGANVHHTSQVRTPDAAQVLGAAGVNDLLGFDRCPGINGQPAAYADGTVVVPLCGGFHSPFEPIVGVTKDNGLTWRVSEFDGDVGQVEIDPDISITPDGAAYLAFRGRDHLVHLLRSRDQFQTWQGPWTVSPPDHTLAAFVTIVSGDDGRLAIAYLGTRTGQSSSRIEALPPDQRPVSEPSEAKAGTIWHLFITTTTDASAETPTFLTVQVTPREDPVQVGCIWMYGGDGGPRACRNLLDFIDMVRDDEGRYYVAFTDGCTPRAGCTADVESATFQTREREISVAVQDAGPSLYADRGLLASLGLEPPQPLAG